MNVLAAQLYAESGFNPFARSPAGAEGIAQFMPGTADAYGLRNPFDPVAAIDAQAHLMSDLLKQFGGKVALALAGYNAGAGAVQQYGGVPPFAETRAYVAKILGLLGGAGEIPVVGGLRGAPGRNEWRAAPQPSSPAASSASSRSRKKRIRLTLSPRNS